MTRGAGARRQRGQTTVEFALIGTVFFFLLIGALETGRAIYGVNAVANGAREGARYAIAQANGNGACNSSNPGLLNAVNASTQGLKVTVTAIQGTTTLGNPQDAYCQVEVDWSFQPADNSFGLPTIPVTSTSRHYYYNNLQ
jgi:Flp pilus assembly protein TadG